MAQWKATLVFNYISNATKPDLPAHRAGGWTETLYFSGTSDAVLAALITAKDSLAKLRAGFLPAGASIIGYRIQQVAPIGPVNSAATSFGPGLPSDEDIPQMAVLIRIHSKTSANARNLILRGVPDIVVVQGEYSPTIGYRDALNAYYNALNNWQFQGLDFNQLKHKIITVSDSGVVVTADNHGYAVGDSVKISRVRLLSGDVSHSQPATVQTVTNPTTFSVVPWNVGFGINGTVRKQVLAFFTIDNTVAIGPRVITRKVGRPFVRYVGRRSKVRR